MATPRCGKILTRGKSKGKPCGRNHGHSGNCAKQSPEMQREWLERKHEADPEYRDRVLRRQREQNRQEYLKGKHEDLAYLYYSPGLGTHKIGHTTNLKHNEMALRRGCWDIELIDTWPGGRELESWLHGRFDDRRISGSEWFRGLTVAEVREAVTRWLEEVSVA